MPTRFQKVVYSKLRQVPKGRVTTYKAIAKALNLRPIATRAVGNAMAKNPNAPTTPCHRVVKSNGEIDNYLTKGGIKRKI